MLCYLVKIRARETPPPQKKKKKIEIFQYVETFLPNFSKMLLGAQLFGANLAQISN
jgi:hypothetical protein